MTPVLSPEALDLHFEQLGLPVDRTDFPHHHIYALQGAYLRVRPADGSVLLFGEHSARRQAAALLRWPGLRLTHGPVRATPFVAPTFNAPPLELPGALRRLGWLDHCLWQWTGTTWDVSGVNVEGWLRRAHYDLEFTAPFPVPVPDGTVRLTLSSDDPGVALAYTDEFTAPHRVPTRAAL